MFGLYLIFLKIVRKIAGKKVALSLVNSGPLADHYFKKNAISLVIAGAALEFLGSSDSGSATGNFG